jgi:subtilisin family serine protease
MSRRARARSLLSCGLVAALIVAGTAVPAAAADTPVAGSYLSATALSPEAGPISVPKSGSGRLAQSDPDLLARTDSAPATVMVKLDYDAVAAYVGGVDDLAATSPEVTGKPLSTSDPAVQSYRAYTAEQTAAAQAAIAQAVPAATVTGSFDLVYGGLAVTVPANQAKDLLAVPGVAAVQSDALQHPLDVQESSLAASGTPDHGSGGGSPTTPPATAVDNDTSTFIGADAVWPSLGGRDKAGQGVVVGVLDTGIWPEHPMLEDKGLAAPTGGPYDCQFGDGTDPLLGAAFGCNDKLVGAYAFLDTALAQGTVGDDEYCDTAAGVCSARDSDGHGTHTSTTAVGDYVDSAVLLGVDRGPISGIAPGASVIMYRVCSEAGCYSSDSVAAVHQAIADGVDVINFSISGGTDAYSDPVELAFLDAYKAGIEVNASAGNDGPGSGTANHAGPWVTTVAASTSDRSFSSALTLTADDGATFTKSGATVTQGVTDAPVVLAANVPGYTGGALCLSPFPADSLTGQVVVCERGTNGRAEKGYYADQGGAAGMILYNPTASDTETDNHWVPAIHLEGPNDELLAFLAAHTGVTATWAAGTVGAATGDVMAGFSSRGPLGDFLKPDITAPGVQVLAGNTPTPVNLLVGQDGQLYQAIAGTSMSSPHAAGVSALVKAAHPDWTPGQIKSALMTSSLQTVTNPDGTAAGVWDRGAGSIRADRAVAPLVTFDVVGADYDASVSDALHRVDLNLPSVDVNPLPGALATQRTATNVSGKTQTFKATASVSGVKVTVTPSAFTLRPGASQKLSILLDGTKAADGWYTGQITLTAGKTTVVLPVAANVGDANVTLDQTCSPTDLAKGSSTTCTVTAANYAAVAADATITVAGASGLDVTSAAAPATKTKTGAKWTGTLSPAVPPSVDSLTADGTSPAGYLPLSLFGIAPAAGFGDETIGNYSVPSFKYGDEVYSRIGVTSDGYIVVGGGTSADVNFVPQTLPDATAPNNVLAPFWTDLNLAPAPDGGGAIRVGTLTDGVNAWIVVDYDSVAPWGFGTGGYAGTAVGNSFQIWIQEGETEGIWFTYGAIGGTPDAYGLTIGAENRAGTSAASVADAIDNLPAAADEYTVYTSGPTAGGTVSFTYQAKASRAGTFDLVSSLSTPVVRATPKAATTVTVTATKPKPHPGPHWIPKPAKHWTGPSHHSTPPKHWTPPKYHW